MHHIQLWFHKQATKQQMSEALIIASTDITLNSVRLDVDRDISLRDNVGNKIGTMFIRFEGQ